MQAPTVENARFLRRPLPKPDESIRGYFLRVMAENGLPLPNERWCTHSAATTSIDQWSQLTGQPVKTLTERLSLVLGPASSGSFVNLAGQLLPSQWITADQKRVCPRCFSEHGYMSLLWEFECILACATHGCFLVGECPRCKEQLRWSSGDFSMCSCGYEIRMLRAKPAAQPLLMLAHLVSVSILNSCRLGSHISHAHPIPASSSWPLNALARIAGILALQRIAFTRRLKKDQRRRTPPVLLEWVPEDEVVDLDEMDDWNQYEDEVVLTRLSWMVQGLKLSLEQREIYRFRLMEDMRGVSLDVELSPFFGLDLQQPELSMHFGNSQGAGDLGCERPVHDDMVPSAPMLWSGIYMTWELSMRSREKSQ